MLASAAKIYPARLKLHSTSLLRILQPTLSASIEHSSMYLLEIPIGLRPRIYSELGVQGGPVEFGADHGPCKPPLNRRVGGQSRNPALLRVRRMVNREVVPLLYSLNSFQFPDAYSTSSSSDVPYIAPFLRQIGANTRLLRHLRITFPASFASANWKIPLLREEYVQVFQLIREACPNLRTAEILSTPPDCIFSLYDVGLAAEMLKALAGRWFERYTLAGEDCRRSRGVRH